MSPASNEERLDGTMDILVPTDGSTAASHALRVAMDLARHRHRLHLVHVVDIRYLEPRLASPEALQDAGGLSEEDADLQAAYSAEAREILDNAADACADMKVAFVRSVRIGIPEAVILKQAAQSGALVMAKQGFSTRQLGAIAHRAVSHARCPVFTVRAYRAPRRVLLLYDDANGCEQLAVALRELLDPAVSSVELLAAHSDAVDTVANHLVEAGFAVEVRRERGPLFEAALAAAAEGTDLLALTGDSRMPAGLLRSELSAVRAARRAHCMTVTFASAATRRVTGFRA